MRYSVPTILLLRAQLGSRGSACRGRRIVWLDPSHPGGLRRGPERSGCRSSPQPTARSWQPGGYRPTRVQHRRCGDPPTPTLGHYADFYEIDHVLVLGRVTYGRGGEIIVQRARHVLATQFPELTMELHVPDERMKRAGQSVAAASLPEIDKETV